MVHMMNMTPTFEQHHSLSMFALKALLTADGLRLCFQLRSPDLGKTHLDLWGVVTITPTCPWCTSLPPLKGCPIQD